MSTALEAPTRTAGPSHAPRPWAAVFALARFEARELRMIGSVLGVAVLYVVWVGYEITRQGDFPVLQDVDRDTQLMPLLVGLVVMMGVNRAVLRSRRRGTDRHFDVLVVEPWRRTAAHVLSVVPVALFTAVCVAVQFGWAAFRPGAVGTGSPAELAVGPLTVLLFGTVGVLLARVFRSFFAAPLALVLLFFFGQIFVTASSPADWTSWLGPVVIEPGSTPFPSGMLGRPAAWHALYLIGLILFVAALAVLVSGGRTTLAKAAVAGSLALTLVGGVGQAGGTPAAALAARELGSASPEKVRSCVEHGRSSYCAFPEWTNRTEDWAAVVDRVQKLAGGRADTERLTVDQRLDARNGLESDTLIAPSAEPGHVSVGTEWGGNRVPEFAVAVASVLVVGDEKAASRICDARVVPIMWMALRGASDPMGSLRDVRLDDSDSGPAIVLSPTETFSMNAEQTRIVAELLRKPRYDVAGKVEAKWAELTSPRTSIERVAELLGVPAAAKTKTASDASGGEDGDSCDNEDEE
ncbi:ABC transporter permease [Streptomyces sp. CWNU-52B]|uniref:ABC transporter permease n=1 Tax=unclassified Streptomyces TaxID=2593676 RepID=UPI0039C127A7